MNSEGSRRGRQRSGGVVSSGVTWAGLWSSIMGYVEKEGDAISKLEEKGSGSSSAYTIRQNKKKARIGAKSIASMFSNLHVNVYITHAFCMVGCFRDGEGILQGCQ